MEQNEHLLRDTRTHRYWNQGHWTSDPEKAETFPEANLAVRVCLENGLHGVELVKRTIPSNYEFEAVLVC